MPSQREKSLRFQIEKSATITAPDLQRLLSQSCESAGGQSSWARQHSIPVSQVCEALSGRRGFSEAIVNALGFIRVDSYIPARKAA